MENTLFFRLEILIFFLSFGYILYAALKKIYTSYCSISRIVKPEQITKRKTSLNKVDIAKKEDNYKKENSKNHKLCDEDKSTLADLVKKVQLQSGKNEFEKAKNMIVEWLAIDKFHKALNIELALIYEKEQKFSSAEYIYKDLLEVYENDVMVMKKLAFMYALQNKLSISLKLYEDIHKKNKADEEVIDMLCEIAYNMKKFKKTLKYTTLYLKSKPRDVEKMFMKADALEELSEISEAIEVYKRILQLQPYNSRAKDSIEFLENS